MSTRIQKLAGLTLICGVLAPWSLWSQNTASIQGTVSAQTSSTAIAGAFVVATRAGLPPFRQTVESAANGSFQIRNLPAGTYSLCVRFSSGAYLDSCEWGQTASSVVLAAGQQSMGNTLRPLTGSIVKVRIQDTAQALFQKASTGATPDLRMGVFARPGVFYPARLVRRDIRGADFELPVPFNTPLSLTVVSKSLRLTDATGAAVPNTGAQAAFQHAAGDPNPQSFTYTVAGLVP